jgi:hypothetical protein
MLKTRFLKVVVLVACTNAYGAMPTAPTRNLPRRISSKVVDLSKVQPIYMVPGMATLIEIPGPVTGIRTGNPDDIQYFRPEKPENEVTIVLRNSKAQPTNLIIRSGKRKYVFDIVPSTSVHQDTVEVAGAFGGPEYEDAVLVDSSESSKTDKGISK